MRGHAAAPAKRPRSPKIDAFAGFLRAAVADWEDPTTIHAPVFTKEFEIAFIATSYALGRRGEELAAPLAEPSAEALALVRALGHSERPTRARVLAAALAPIAKTLEQRRLW